VRIPQKRVGSEVCGTQLTADLRNADFHGTQITKKTQFLRERMDDASVLVVDDVESNIYVTNGMLQPYGIKVESVSNGFLAVEKIEQGNVYDIIFMDHMMPVMDGVQATKLIRETGYSNPIVALTANAIIGRREMFLQNGFDAFISKPIDSRILNQVLNNFIRNKKLSISMVKTDNTPKPISEKLAQAIARDFKKSIPVLEKMLNEIKSGEITDSNMELFTMTAHSMKSALGNLGEVELSSSALKLERAGNSRDIDVIVQDTPILLEKLRTILESL
jgi:CheY-like chemotaxis protein